MGALAELSSIFHGSSIAEEAKDKTNRSKVKSFLNNVIY